MSDYIKISDIPFRDLAEGHNTDIKVLVAFASDIKNLPTIEVSEDCISREWVKGICEDMLDEEMLGHMLGYIENAPSVIPTQNNAIQHVESVEKPKEGEWIVEHGVMWPGDDIYGDMYRCSVCGIRERDVDGLNYCYNCGAKMKGAR